MWLLLGPKPRRHSNGLNPARHSSGETQRETRLADHQSVRAGAYHVAEELRMSVRNCAQETT